MEIKCIITDDEPVARKGLKSYIEKIDFLSLIAECDSATKLNTVLKETPTDVIFLDIEMPDITGIEFLSAVTNPPKVIIVSAYEEYALKGYELNVFDYLLKPVTYERFLKSVNKLYDQIAIERNAATEYIFIKSDKKTKKIFLKDILFVESMENYVLIHTTTSREIVYSTLKQVQESLPPAMFVQTHRCYVVNLQHINAIEGNQLEVGPHKVPIARNIKDSFFNDFIARNLIVRKNTNNE
jgi:DNA-binding LytR/AlgR family response regulator